MPLQKGRAWTQITSRANLETIIPGMLGSGVRPGQKVGGITLSSCRNGDPDSRPTHTWVSHFQNHSRLSYPVCKFNGPRTLPNRVRKLFPNWQSKQDQNLQVGSITPGIPKHERGQYRNASPHPQEACTGSDLLLFCAHSTSFPLFPIPTPTKVIQQAPSAFLARTQCKLSLL